MLDRLSRRPGSRKAKTRVGRGCASGRGKTCGRGQKGAGARSGSKRRSWAEGGQMPLSRRLPKVGFRNPGRVRRQVVNVDDLQRFDAGTVVDVAALVAAGLIPSVDRPVKILAEGDLDRSVTVRVSEISAAARKKVEAAGGTVEIKPVTRRRSGGASKP